jgi:bifunctional UDP-N-acetylglucosamine pyrophosphorylase/glucosamine-1-phosphate N-acetyltransferase
MRLLIVPAAGAGSRLGGGAPKILVPVAGRPMIDYLVDVYRSLVDGVVVVTHPTFTAAVRAHVAAAPVACTVVEQRERTGMLDAVLLAGPIVNTRAPDEVWITWGDQVGVLPATVRRLARVMSEQPRPAMALPTVRRRHPYTHFERDPAGTITRFLQRRERDSMPDEGESDIGVFAMRRDVYERDLQQYARSAAPGRATGERNFVPFVAWLAPRTPVATFPCTDEREAIGINTPEELRAVEDWLRSRTA